MLAKVNSVGKVLGPALGLRYVTANSTVFRSKVWPVDKMSTWLGKMPGTTEE